MTDKHRSRWITTKGHTKWPRNNGREIARAIEKGEAIAVSDGSHLEGEGTCAWIISSTGSKWSSAARVSRPGKIKADPYRGELFGIYSLLVALEILCNNHQITQGKVKLYCDGKSALEDAFKLDLHHSYKKPHSDILAAIINIRKKLPIMIEPHHVDGHQDRHEEHENRQKLAIIQP